MRRMFLGAPGPDRGHCPISELESESTWPAGIKNCPGAGMIMTSTVPVAMMIMMRTGMACARMLIITQY